jgi:hypothetical protein
MAGNQYNSTYREQGGRPWGSATGSGQGTTWRLGMSERSHAEGPVRRVPEAGMAVDGSVLREPAAGGSTRGATGGRAVVLDKVVSEVVGAGSARTVNQPTCPAPWRTPCALEWFVHGRPNSKEETSCLRVRCQVGGVSPNGTSVAGRGYLRPVRLQFSLLGVRSTATPWSWRTFTRSSSS